jgi:hypothetical protein
MLKYFPDSFVSPCIDQVEAGQAAMDYNNLSE